MRRYPEAVFQGALALGSPSGFFSPAKFLPSRPALRQAPHREPVDGVDVTHGQCLCEFMNQNELGQGCAVPTGGGESGSADFGTDAVSSGPSSNTILTIAAATGAGVAALLLLKIL